MCEEGAKIMYIHRAEFVKVNKEGKLFFWTLIFQLGFVSYVLLGAVQLSLLR